MPGKRSVNNARKPAGSLVSGFGRDVFVSLGAEESDGPVGMGRKGRETEAAAGVFIRNSQQ